jgi:excisionase family DNA binding protein
MALDNLFNISQVAFILKVHPLTIRRYVREGKLKAVKIGGNVRIKEMELQNFNKDVTPAPTNKSFPRERKTPVKIFSEFDPIFQLQGKGAALNL